MPQAGEVLCDVSGITMGLGSSSRRLQPQIQIRGPRWLPSVRRWAGTAADRLATRGTPGRCWNPQPVGARNLTHPTKRRETSRPSKRTLPGIAQSSGWAPVRDRRGAEAGVRDIRPRLPILQGCTSESGDRRCPASSVRRNGAASRFPAARADTTRRPAASRRRPYESTTAAATAPPTSEGRLRR